MGIKGEPSTPKDPSEGQVWCSIVDLLEKEGSENTFISVLDQPRSLYSAHPWSIGGGGVGELKQLLEEQPQTLKQRIDLIGFGAILGEDEAFGVPLSKVSSCRFPKANRPLIEGDLVRDWSLSSSTCVLFPYDANILFAASPDIMRYLWSLRVNLWARKTFGNKTYKTAGKNYPEYHQIPVERNRIDLSITFAFVSTHNHFVLDDGGKVFKQSAPIIKLKTGATKNEHLALLGLLNSSVACFWMKQVFHNKGDSTDSRGARVTGDPAFDTYEFAGTGLKKFPVADDPKEKAIFYANELSLLAQKSCHVGPESSIKSISHGFKDALKFSKNLSKSITSQMIFIQEELDWLNYSLYGLVDEDFNYYGEMTEINFSERSFEISLARNMVSNGYESTWFKRHNVKPVTDIPAHWPKEYRELIEKRLSAIEHNRWIKLIEQPEYKRRWNAEPWSKREERALKEWLLDHLESQTHNAELQTSAQLADRVRNNSDFQEVAALYTGTDTYDVQALISELIASDNIPQMAAARYKPKAMKKFRAWQETWDKQRAEDVIDARQELAEDDSEYLTKKEAEDLKAETIGDIPLPPKYASGDFRKPAYWPLRGKLDVPKERFFSMPGCEKSGDSTLVIGWAGLNHLERAQAIAAWYLDRKENEAWSAEQLMPMLVSLDELTPWLKQWHNDVDPEFGERLGDYYESFLLEELRTLNISRDELLSWEPVVTKRSGGRRKKAS